jgi:hypothetical protein
MARGFALADRNPDLLWLYIPRAIALIAAFPDRAAEFPTPQALREAAKDGLAANTDSDLPAHLRADLCDGLEALARTLERLIGTPEGQADKRRETVIQTAARVA